MLKYQKSVFSSFLDHWTKITCYLYQLKVSRLLKMKTIRKVTLLCLFRIESRYFQWEIEQKWYQNGTNRWWGYHLTACPRYLTLVLFRVIHVNSVILGYFGLFWFILGYFGLFLVILGHFFSWKKPFWPFYQISGFSLQVLAQKQLIKQVLAIKTRSKLIVALGFCKI